MKSCKIVRHFIEECKGVSNLRLIIVDVLNNVDHFSSDEIEDLLLQKQQFWIGTLVTQRKGLNCDPWLEENKAFSKGKVTEEMKFFNPNISVVYGNQLLIYSKNQLTCFFLVGILGLRKHN